MSQGVASSTTHHLPRARHETGLPSPVISPGRFWKRCWFLGMEICSLHPVVACGTWFLHYWPSPDILIIKLQMVLPVNTALLTSCKLQGHLQSQSREQLCNPPQRKKLMEKSWARTDYNWALVLTLPASTLLTTASFGQLAIMSITMGQTEC